MYSAFFVSTHFFSAQTQVLSFERCKRIEDDVLSEALPMLPNLRHLSVSGTRVKAPGLLAIARHCPELRELDVSSLMEFTDDVATAVLGPTAAHGGRLTTFLCSACTRVTSIGASHLAHNPNLQILSLHFTSAIEDMSFLALLHQAGCHAD